MQEDVKPSRRGLRQEIVVEALRSMRGREHEFSDANPGFATLTQSLLVDAENKVLYANAPGYAPPLDPQPVPDEPPRYIQPATFIKLMGIGRVDAAELESLVKARLEVSSGATDGK